MKSHMRILCFLAGLAIVTGCSETNKPEDTSVENNDAQAASSESDKEEKKRDLGPKETLLRFLDAVERAGIDSRSSETYSFLSSSDQQAISEREYLSKARLRDEQVSAEFMEIFNEKTSHTFKSSEIKDDSATFEVETRFPDLKNSFWKSASEGDLTNKQEQEAISYMQKEDLDFEKYTEEHNLVKENGAWKIFYDYKTHQKIDELIIEAQDLLTFEDSLVLVDGSELVSRKSDLLLVEEKYEKALSLGDSARAESGLKRVRKWLSKLDFFEKYKDKIKIQNVSVGEGQSGSTGIFGEIKNTSEIPFSEVKITIYFLDSGGKPVHEASYTPVLEGQQTYTGYGGPLKPNYTRKFGYRADGAPSDWAGDVNVAITNLEEM